jgi:hypothetical protein
MNENEEEKADKEKNEALLLNVKQVATKKDEDIEKMMDSMSNGDFSGAMNLANSMMSQMGGQGGMEGGLLNMVSSLMGGQGGPENIMSMMGNMMGNNVNIETIKDEDTLE